MPDVFLSYSIHDAVMARLILHIFQENDVDCFLAERDIPIGSHFDSEIASKIKTSSALLVLWSSHAASSPWVNQEVGIALAQNIPVWPVAIEEIDIEGAIFRNQGVYLTRHRDPHAQIAALAREIRSSRPKAYRSLSASIDQYIVGKEARTQRLIRLLSEEGEKAGARYALRIQAAFSSLAASADSGYRVGGYHTPEYHDLLVQELQGTKRMICRGSLKAILWPRRPYDDRFLRIRFGNLVAFLEANRNYHRVRFVVGPYQGGNMYIFDRNVLVEGIKIRTDAPGYELTTLTYHAPTIRSAIASFDGRFKELWQEHAVACGADDPKRIRSYVIEELKRLGGVR